MVYVRIGRASGGAECNEGRLSEGRASDSCPYEPRTSNLHVGILRKTLQKLRKSSHVVVTELNMGCHLHFFFYKNHVFSAQPGKEIEITTDN